MQTGGARTGGGVRGVAGHGGDGRGVATAHSTQAREVGE